MDRRGFLKLLGGAAILPVIPVEAKTVKEPPKNLPVNGGSKRDPFEEINTLAWKTWHTANSS